MIQFAQAPRRFVLLGSVLVDIVLGVDEPPALGDDVLADGGIVTAGGGFNVLAATRRQGMPSLYAGRIGTGPFGDHVAVALAREGVETVLGRTPEGDTGFCVVMVDRRGERTMVTNAGVDGNLQPDELSRIELRDDDFIYVSGYDLVYPHGPLLIAWLETTVSPHHQLILDPGPLAEKIQIELLNAVLRRASWLSLNAREARALSDRAGLEDAGRALLARADNLDGVVVRNGAAGCLLITPSSVTDVPGFPTTMIDSTGAGDCHVGVFSAAISRGESPAQACHEANAAAALAVSRQGPATAPERAEVLKFSSNTARNRG